MRERRAGGYLIPIQDTRTGTVICRPSVQPLKLILKKIQADSYLMNFIALNGFTSSI